MICRTALPLLLGVPCAGLAQEPPAPPGEAPVEVAFSAERLVYDEPADTVTATGEVRMNREGYHLRADSVSWNRQTGEVRAEGGVRITSPGGDVAYGDSVLLEDTLRDGVVHNLLLVLADGGRLAAARAERHDGVTTLHRAAYTACEVVDSDGCPKDPTWQITAVRVVHDPVRHRISYRGATLNLFGAPIIGLPGLSHPDGSQGGGSGFLVPEIRYSRRNGLELSAPYYIRFGPNRDATLTPHVYTGVLPMLEAQYRQLTSAGAFQIHGYVTHGSRLQLNPQIPAPGDDEGLRAYVEGGGRFILSPRWSVTAFGRYTTDRTFMRRYDISRDDRLRSFVNAERVTEDSYISIAGWAFQGLRLTDVDGLQPIALPAIDARWRLADPWLGGRIELQANSLAVTRTEGQDSQRAFASARWDRRTITPMGQELVLTAYARGDLYHANDTLLDPDGQLSRPRGLGRALHRRGRRRRPLAVHRRVPGRHPAPHPAPPGRRLAADREYGHPQRGRPLGRPRGFEPVRAEPLPRLTTAGRTGCASPTASTGRPTCRASRSAPISARATGSTASPRSCRPAPASRAASPTSSAAPTFASAASSASPTASASTRTAWRCAATRSTR